MYLFSFPNWIERVTNGAISFIFHRSIIEAAIVQERFKWPNKALVLIYDAGIFAGIICYLK